MALTDRVLVRRVVAARVLVCAVLVSMAAGVRAQVDADGETRLEMNIGGRTVERMVRGHEEWVYQWPAIYFESQFAGDHVRLQFDDASNNFNVLVDDRPLMLVKRPGRTSVTLDHLGAGTHTVRLEKVTETREETGAFAGFFVANAEEALPAKVAERRIEFVGDSLTVGFGNMSAFGTCSKEELFATTNAQESFGPLVAKHYKAEYRVEAFSGLGLVRNAGGTLYPQYSLPILWPRTLFDDPAEGATPWSPQVIVIGIGGNDFSLPFGSNERWKTQAEMAAEFERTYEAFIKSLRRSYPNALIVMMWTSDKSAEFTRSAAHVYATLQSDGMKNIDRLELPKMERTGCQNHPNIHDDAAVAKLFEAVIDTHNGAWQGH